MLTIDVVFPEYFHNFMLARPQYRVESLTLLDVVGNGVRIYDAENEKHRFLSYYDPLDMLIISRSHGIHIDIKKELYLLLNGEINDKAEVKAEGEDRLPITVTFSDELKGRLSKEDLTPVQIRFGKEGRNFLVVRRPDGATFETNNSVGINLVNCGQRLDAQLLAQSA